MPTKIERYYLILVFSIFSALPFLEGVQPVLTNDVEEIGNMNVDGDTNKQIILLMLYAGCSSLLVLRMPTKMLFLVGTPLLILMTWCFASAGWSDAPDLALRRTTALFGTFIVGAYAGLRFNLSSMSRLLSYVTGIVLVSSLALAVVAPSSGLDPLGWLRGVFSHKNFIGAYAAFALLTLVARILEIRRRGELIGIGDPFLILVSVLCLGLSHSATPIPALFVALLLMLAANLVRNAHGRVLVLVPAIVGLLIFGLTALVSNIDAIAALLERDPDFSGRILVWEFAKRMISERLWMGYGYGTFWTGVNAPGAVFFDLTHLAVPHAHNGYLQLLLDAGAIGLALAAAALVVLIVRTVWILRHSRQPYIDWVLASVGFFLTLNLAESRLWVGNDLITALFVYFVVRVNAIIHYAHARIASSARQLYGPSFVAKFEHESGKASDSFRH